MGWNDLTLKKFLELFTTNNGCQVTILTVPVVQRGLGNPHIISARCRYFITCAPFTQSKTAVLKKIFVEGFHFYKAESERRPFFVIMVMVKMKAYRVSHLMAISITLFMFTGELGLFIFLSAGKSNCKSVSKCFLNGDF